MCAYLFSINISRKWLKIQAKAQEKVQHVRNKTAGSWALPVWGRAYEYAFLSAPRWIWCRRLILWETLVDIVGSVRELYKIVPSFQVAYSGDRKWFGSSWELWERNRQCLILPLWSLPSIKSKFAKGSCGDVMQWNFPFAPDKCITTILHIPY